MKAGADGPTVAEQDPERGAVAIALQGAPESHALFLERYTPDLFADPRWGALASIIARRLETGLPVDPTAAPEIARAAQETHVSLSVADVCELASSEPTATALRFYFDALEEARTARALSEAGRRLQAAAGDANGQRAEAVRDVLACLQQMDQAFGNLLRVHRLVDLLQSPPPPRPPIVAPVLHRGGSALLVGAPKKGKSLFAQGMGLAVATGRDFLGFSTERMPVLHLWGESGLGDAYQRGKAMLGGGECPPDYFLWEPSATEHLNLDEAADRRKLIRTCRQLGIGLIIVDPLVRLYGAIDENSTQEMRRLTLALQEVQEATGAGMLLVHHTRKPGLGSKPGQAAESRGSGVLIGEVDSILIFDRRENGDFTLHFELRRAPTPDPLRLTLDPDTLRFEVAGALTGRRKLDPERLARVLLDHGPSTVAELLELTGVSRATLDENLRALKAAGRVRDGKGPDGKTKVWELAEPANELPF